MSLQQLYDDICSHLDRQGCKATHEDCVGVPGGCRYRDVLGRRCAIGGIIPDEEYMTSMEGEVVGGLLEHHPSLLEYFLEHYSLKESTGEAEGLLLGAQEVHDQADVKRWPDHFKQVAINFSLIPFTFTHPNIVGEKHD